MIAPWRWRVAIVLGAILLFQGSLARADSRTDFLVQRLKSDDFRVRTNAALALGATNDDAAVQPLCTMLEDTSEVVRQATAVALKRLLRPASVSCLKKRLDAEKNDSVKLQIARAVEAIEASAGAPSDEPPKVVAGAKYYLAISPITNNTGRPQSDVDRVVLSAMRSRLEEIGQYQLAPAKESADGARAVMQKRKLKGFYLTLTVDRLDYSTDGLKVTMRVVIFSYPGKAMQGMFSKWKVQSGTRPGDKSAEDTLIGSVASAAADYFAENAAKF